MKQITQVLCFVLFAITLFGSESFSQPNRTKDTISEAKAGQLMSLSRSIVKRSARGEAIEGIAKERYELMKALAEKDPARVMQNALATDVLDRMPENLRRYFESREKLEGELEVIAECEENDGLIQRFLIQGDRRIPLFFAKEPGDELRIGAKVMVSGVSVDGKMAVESYISAPVAPTNAPRTVESSALAGTTGEHKVLVILVNFQDEQTQPFTPDLARDVTFNTTSNFYREASYGKTWLTGDVFGWYTIPLSSTVCDKTAIATYAKQAAANGGANLAAYNHFVYAFPMNACTFSGSATVGGTNQVWVNGWFELGIVGHELGHNLGLSHSRSLDCGSVVLGDNCTTVEYGDTVDLMGAANSAHFNLFQKERLGWVNSAGAPAVQTVSESGTYWVDAYVPDGANPKGLKILKSTDPVTGNKTWYYIERRTASGFDSYLSSNTNVMNGVVVHTGTDSAYQSYLLDMTPTTNSWDDPALTIGQSFTDPGSGVTITTVSADSTGAWVQVNIPTQSCVRANPTVSVTPGASNGVTPGTVVGYNVTVTNNNTGGCASGIFNLGSSVPSGFAASYSSQTIEVQNGGSASSILSISSPLGAGDGTYGIGVSAVNMEDQTYTGSSSASYNIVNIVSGLAVTLTPGATVYSLSQTASVTAVVRLGGSPIANANVNFTMTKSSGAVVTKTVKTNSSGNAVFSYRFDRRRDPMGTYRVNAATTKNGQTGQGATSFTVGDGK